MQGYEFIFIYISLIIVSIFQFILTDFIKGDYIILGYKFNITSLEIENYKLNFIKIIYMKKEIAVCEKLLFNFVKLNIIEFDSIEKKFDLVSILFMDFIKSKYKILFHGIGVLTSADKMFLQEIKFMPSICLYFELIVSFFFLFAELV
jgi:hypothetical protein